MRSFDLVDDGAAPTIQRLRRVHSVADSLVTSLESQIKSEKLVAGTRLGTKNDLCAAFGVAPATLGEALRVLRARGAVEVRPGPGGGVFVAQQSPLIKLAHSVLDLRQRGATVNEVIGVLDALDEAVTREATLHRTDADLIELDELMDHLASVWHDPQERLHCNWKLHRRIAEITPNVVLRTFYQNLVDYIEGERNLENPLEIPGFEPSSDARLRVHYDLVEAIRSGNPEDSRVAVIKHRTS